MKRLLHRIRRWWRARKFKAKYGFPVEETWNLNVELAKWLAPRLRGLAAVTNGCPPGYGGYYYEDGDAFFWDVTGPHKLEDRNFSEWKIDLKQHSYHLERYAAEAYDLDKDDHHTTFKDYQDSLKWVAEYMGYLWW